MKLVFDMLLFYKEVTAHPEQVRLRQRVEERLMALKQKGILYESATECVSAAPLAASAAQAINATVGTIAEYSLVHHWRASNR